MSRRINFEKSYESYMKRFEADWEKGVMTKDPLTFKQYKNILNTGLKVGSFTANEKKNLARTMYGEYGRENKAGRVRAARTAMRWAREVIMDKMRKGEEISAAEKHIMNLKGGFLNFVNRSQDYIESFIAAFGRQDFESIVSP